MADLSRSIPDHLNDLAEEFVDRFRRGERPSLTEYTSRHPELAEEIRELFPALVMIEDLGSVAGQPALSSPGPIPERLGDFQIVREIARGGMGVVYEAVQESLGRHVALKVLPLHALLEPSLLERFRREAKAAARLHHTNIVPVFGIGEHDGIHYYAMQYIQGQSLEEVIGEVKRLRAGQTSTEIELKRPSAAVARALLTDSFQRGAGPGLNVGDAAGVARSGDNLRPPAPAPAPSNANGSAPAPATEPAAAAVAAPSFQRADRQVENLPPQPMSLGAATPAEKVPCNKAGDNSSLTTQSEAQYFRSVARLGMQIAEGLEYAHRQGILHRDIKPSNLLLDLHGTVWITDFGLAKVDDSSELTRAGDIVGTVRFMAPERLDGKSEPRSDIYGLGITLYELLTLAPAYADSQRGRLIERIMKEDPPPPRKLDPAVPRDLETIVLKAIAKEPNRRYATAEDMAEDLRRFLADRPIQARRTPWREKAWRWCRRNPGVASLSGAVAALVAVLLVGVGIAAVLRRDKVRAEQAEARALNAEREVKIRSHLNRAMAYRRSGQGGQRFLCLDEAAKALKLNPDAEVRRDLSREVLACLALPDLYLNPARQGAAYPSGTVWVDFDDTLKIYARTDSQGYCSIRRVAGDEELMRLPALGESAIVHLSRDGRFAAVCAAGNPGGRLQVWKLDGRKPKVLIEPEEPVLWAMDFRRDSRQLAVPLRDGAISVYDLATGLRLYHLAPLGTPEDITRQMVLALHPTEPLVAVCSYSSKVVQVRDLRTGAVRANLAYPDGGNWVAWHPAGHTLAASAGDDNSIHLYDRATFKRIRTLETKSWGSRMVFNHAGDRLASSGWGGGVQLWDAATGQLLISLLPVMIHTLRFSRDDQQLAGCVRDQKVGIWQISDGRDHRTLTRASLPKKTFPQSVAIHKDGRLLAVGWTDGLGFWDLDSGAELDFVPIKGGVRSLLFEPSGALLTNGPSHLCRWPVRSEPAAPGTLQIGPPEQLALPGSGGVILQSGDGRVLVQAQRAVGENRRRAGAWVLHADRPRQPICLDKGQDIVQVAVSPDGRWIATSLMYSSTIKIWEAATGQMVKKLPGDLRTGCLFSPDGSWLATAHDGNRLFALPSWTKGPQLGEGGILAFSPDSRLVALETYAGAVRLVEVASGKEVARLEDPNLDLASALFTPDGARLITMTQDRVKGVHVWDLKAVRQALRWLAGELDHLPDQLSAPATPAMPLRVEVDRTGLPDVPQTGLVAWSLAIALQPLNPVAYYRRALNYSALGKYPEATKDCRLAAAWHPDWQTLIAKSPARPLDLNNLAWAFVVKPASPHDARIAVCLAEQAVKLDVTDPTHHNTLGVAYYRSGRLADAVAQLEISRKESRGRADAHDLYFLAMCRHALGQPAPARADFERAVAWRKQQRSVPPEWTAELDAFHAEAAALLGVRDQLHP